MKITEIGLMNTTNKQSGNVLFLILIAVALFAALSYAVTQSTRGGGNANAEQLALKAAELINQSNHIRTTALRLYALSEVDQIRLDASSYNPAGNIYLDATAGASPGTGRTVGVFSSSEGVPKYLPPIELWNNVDIENQFGWYIFPHTAITVNSIDIGSSADDEVLYTQFLSQDACEAINKELTGSTTIPGYTTSGPSNRDNEVLFRDGAFFNSTIITSSVDLGVMPGCNESGSGSGRYMYWDVIRER